MNNWDIFGEQIKTQSVRDLGHKNVLVLFVFKYIK